MAEYIEREALLKIYKGWLPQLERPQDIGDKTGVETCIAVLEDAPAADVVEVEHGYWDKITMYKSGECFAHCSICGTSQEVRYPSELPMYHKYCRWCGAKMDGKAKSNAG